ETEAPGEAAAVRRELAEMQAQMQRMAARSETLESQLAESRAAAAGLAVEAAGAGDAKPWAKVAWKGAPEIAGEGGWSFKPRGRMQLDGGFVDGPGGSGTHGFASELRRVYLGVDGAMPGGFGYRLEADFAGSEVQLTDVYMTYKADDALTFTAGYH